MSRPNFYVVGFVILILAIVGNTVIVLHTKGETTTTQRQLAQSTKESAETRITTVTQRCELTKLILDVLDGQDPSVAPAFHRSYVGCMVQLAHVVAINERTPGR